uniref:Uncharacterized protein n=1 Tax=Megaviridae environmental sample TaxID=1737588 RepID=A0A5J6VK71_9VIRU|nr:MAG: hypothetical protein [Megaviridae environmental sample]
MSKQSTDKRINLDNKIKKPSCVTPCKKEGFLTSTNTLCSSEIKGSPKCFNDEDNINDCNPKKDGTITEYLQTYELVRAVNFLGMFHIESYVSWYKILDRRLNNLSLYFNNKRLIMLGVKKYNNEIRNLPDLCAQLLVKFNKIYNKNPHTKNIYNKVLKKLLSRNLEKFVHKFIGVEQI